MINGSIYIMDDPVAAFNAVANANGSCKLIVLSEDIQIDMNDSNIALATCLMPPPMARIAEIDGDAEMFHMLYEEHLLSDVPIDFISIMLGYLYRGGNLIFLTQVGLDEPWLNMLMVHFIGYYGIHIGSANAQFWYDGNYDEGINNILFSSDIITSEEYLINHNPAIEIPAWNLNKLVQLMPIPEVGQDPRVLSTMYGNISQMLKSGAQSAVLFKR